MPKKHSLSMREAAKELGKPADAITPTELMNYDYEDLPPGRPSDLGGEVQNRLLHTRTESETRRLAQIGKAIVDNSDAAKRG